MNTTPTDGLIALIALIANLAKRIRAAVFARGTTTDNPVRATTILDLDGWREKYRAQGEQVAEWLRLRCYENDGPGCNHAYPVRTPTPAGRTRQTPFQTGRSVSVVAPC